MPQPNHLIVVCGHAIWKGGPSKGLDEAEWLIESYKKGETPTFIEHIKSGVQVLSRDSRAVLVFSGGPTRKETPISEASSYCNLAVANSFFGLIPEHESQSLLKTSRILLEERALDSYYNIHFSVIEFWRAHGVWPEQLTIVSHEFKRNRLVDGHCAAIGFPLDRVNFVGINPPGVEGMGLGDASGGEAEGQVSGEKADAMRGVQLALGQWAGDPHGVGEELASKRRMRNCWDVDQTIFFNDQERERSGVVTVMLEDGSEALTEQGIVHLKMR